MCNIKISEKFKELIKKESLAEAFLKGITIAACTLSTILLLFMLFSGRTSGYGNPTYELDSANGSSSRSSDSHEQDSKGNGADKSADNSTDYSGDDENSKQHGLSSGPDSGDSNIITLSLTDNEASDLIALAFSERLPITDVGISFFAPDTVNVHGTVCKSDLGELFLEQDLPLLQAALILSPEMLEGELTFKVALEGDGGKKLSAVPERVLINGINVTRFIPHSAVESANEALSSLIPDGASLRQIVIEDCSITFTLEVAQK